MKRLIIADIKSNNNQGICTGHFYAVAENYYSVFSKHVSTKIASGPIYLKNFKKDDMLLLPCDYIAGENKIKNLFRFIRNGWHLFRRVNKDDVVVLQQSNPANILCSILLTYFGNTNLYQIQYSDEPMRRFYYRVLMKFLRGRIKGIICPNDKVGKAFGLPYVVVPDYMYFDDEEQDSLSLTEKKYDFGILGRIAKDKGVAECVSFLAGKDCRVIVAGTPQDDNEKESILESVKKCDNIDLHLNYISDVEYNFYLDQSKYCILNYSGTYMERSSGVVLDTLFHGVPVVGKRCNALKFIEDMNLGLLYENINELDMDNMFNEAQYASFVKSIDLYKKGFKKYILDLKDFLKL